jgi:MFS family permease|tara:strand:+ start:55 stop:1290 length:1236 start_codon:yes stop_codon:yes gene_type:complete
MIIDIIRSNFKIIIFGFVFTFFSSVGQSFFIGLFNSSIREEINISHGEFGTIYGIATLCSSLTLIWLGKKIDELKLFNYSFLVVIFLGFSALFFSFVNGIVFLAIGIFFLRLSGQGLMAHTASVAIGRFFDRSRGKALSYVWIGMSLGEFLLPVIIVYFLTLIYWRNVWQGVGIIILLTLPIFTYLTIRGINIFSRENSNRHNTSKNAEVIKSWTRKEVLKDLKFYSILPAMLASSFIITGIVINQTFIVVSKDWEKFAIAKSFMIYSILTVATLFLSGFLVDKFTSRKIFPLLNFPLLLSLVILIFFNHPISAYVFMGFMGMSNGLTNVLMSSFWAEIYGVHYLGSIKALTGSMMVFSTALAAVVFGTLIDLGYSIENIAFLCAIYTAISIAIVIIFKKAYQPVLLENKT